MFKIELSIRSVKGLPPLGLTTAPSPYLIVTCEELKSVTSIAKCTQNPNWNFNCILAADSLTSLVYFYIYNNNPNTVDELLAHCCMQFESLMTNVLTDTQVRLSTANNRALDSFVQLQHYSVSRASPQIVFTSSSAIKLSLIGDLPSASRLAITYGHHSSVLCSPNLVETTMSWQKDMDEISIDLIATGQTLHNKILVANLAECDYHRLTYSTLQAQFEVGLLSTVIKDGMLQADCNCLEIEMQEASQGNQTNVIQIKVHGPLGNGIMSSKSKSKSCRIYVQNSCQLQFQIFQNAQNSLQELEPTHTRIVSINALKWSQMQCNYCISYLDRHANSQIVISLTMKIIKNLNLKPKLEPPIIQASKKSSIAIQNIKISNCYLYEIFKPNTLLYLYHRSHTGDICMFSATALKQSSEIVFESTLRFNDQAKGWLYLAVFDVPLAENQIFNSQCIFKIDWTGDKAGQVHWTSTFLAYAKKISLINICKNFNQMIHDSTMQLAIKSQTVGQFKKGILTIRNARVQGEFADVDLRFLIDGNNIRCCGQTGRYLLSKESRLFIADSNCELQCTVNSKKYSIFGSFCDLFGEPEMNKDYIYENILDSYRLRIVYAFQAEDQIVVQVNSVEFGQRSNQDIALKLMRIENLPVANRQYQLKISRGSQMVSSLVYSPINDFIIFSSMEEYNLPQQSKQTDNLFFYLEFHDEKNKFVIYSGHLATVALLPKSICQVTLQSPEPKQKSIILTVANNSAAIWPELPNKIQSKAKMQVNGIKSSFQLRSIYKYYLVILVNGMLQSVQKAIPSELGLTLTCTFSLARNDILLFQLYVSYKELAKQLFMQEDKQLFATGGITCNQIQAKGCLLMRCWPVKQQVNKLSADQLRIIQNRDTLAVLYSCEYATLNSGSVDSSTIQTPRIDLDVLSSGVAHVKITKLMPLVQSDCKVVHYQISQCSSYGGCSQISTQLAEVFLVQLENMQFQVEVKMLLKSGNHYKNVSGSQKVSLKRKNIKCNQLTYLHMHIPNIAGLKLEVVVLNNKYTDFPKGVVSLEGNIAFPASNFKTSAYFLKNFNQIKSLQLLQVIQNNKIQKIKFESDNSKACFVLIFLKKSMPTIRLVIPLADLNIRAFEPNETVFTKSLSIEGQQCMLKIVAVYHKTTKLEESSLAKSQVYTIYAQNYCKTLSLGLVTDFQPSSRNQLPARVDGGVLLNVTIPPQIVKELPFIELADDSKQTIKLYRNPLTLSYAKYLNRPKNILSMNLQEPHTSQNLGNDKNRQKFIIDQKYISVLTQTGYKVANTSACEYTFQIHFHCLFTQSSVKRLASLKHSPNDDILTNKFGLQLVHATQKRILHNIRMEGILDLAQSQSHSCQFGYDPSQDCVQVTLFLQNCFNCQGQNLEFSTDNWTQFMPVAHGTLPLNLNSSLVGCKLTALPNYNETVDRSLRDIIIIQPDINFLCGLSFSKRSWGYKTLQLKSCSPIVVKDKKQESSFIYFKFQIESNDRKILFFKSTEARKLTPNKNLIYNKGILSFFFINSQTIQGYNLKISGYYADSNTSANLFVEKRHSIADFLKQNISLQFTVQTKNALTNNFCQIFEISFALDSDSSQQPKKMQGASKRAKQVNNVDALSFQSQSRDQILIRLASCQQRSHFIEIMVQIRQMFIYVEQNLNQMLALLTEYLSFSNDSEIIAIVTDILEIMLLKYPNTVHALEADIPNIYKNIKRISEGKTDISSLNSKVQSSKNYQLLIENFAKTKDRHSFKLITQAQFTTFYRSAEKILPAEQNSLSTLNIILQLKDSEYMRKQFTDQILWWVDLLAFREDKSFKQFMILVSSFCVQLQNNQLFLCKISQILLHRQYDLPTLLGFWSKISAKQQKNIFMEDIILKYSQLILNRPYEIFKGFKIILTDLKNNQLNKQDKLKPRNLYFDGASSLIIKQLPKLTQIALISCYLEFEAALYSSKLLSEDHQLNLISIVREKVSQNKQTINKAIFSSFLNRIGVPTSKATNKPENQARFKSGSFGKYLITND